METIIITKCENGHEDRHAVRQLAGQNVTRADQEYWDTYKKLVEWSSNDSPLASGCLTCGGKVIVEVEREACVVDGEYCKTHQCGATDDLHCDKAGCPHCYRGWRRWTV